MKKETQIRICKIIGIPVAIIVVIFLAIVIFVPSPQKETAKQTSGQKKATQQIAENKTKKTTNKQNSQTKGVELKQLFKLSDIKDKSQEEVNTILGQPTGNRKETWHYYDTKEEAPNCFTNIYEKNNMEIEIFFIDGKAARVTVTPKNTIAAGDVDNILKMFYLTYDEPEFTNKLGTRWNNKFGVYEFAINFEGEKVSFINIILDEKYR